MEVVIGVMTKELVKDARELNLVCAGFGVQMVGGSAEDAMAQLNIAEVKAKCILHTIETLKQHI